MSPKIRNSLLAVGGLVLAIQLVPYRVQNPPVTQDAEWDSAETRALAERACFDCHSNQVKTPWYGYVAPVAWVVRHHVDEGREHLNFSEMDTPQRDAGEAAEEAEEGHMPPDYYLKMHPEARFTPEETQALVEGLEATFGREEHHGPPPGGRPPQH